MCAWGDDYGVRRGRIEREFHPVLLRCFSRTLEHAAVEENPPARGFQQMTGTGHLPGRAEKGRVGVGI